VNPGLPLGQIAQNFSSFAPFGSRTANGVRINFDGILKTSNSDPSSEQLAYTQLYRNGIIETVRTLGESSGKLVIFITLGDTLIQEIVRVLNDLADVGIEPPYALLVSLIGVKDAQINFERGQYRAWDSDLSDSLDRDQYHFDEVIFETIPTARAECAGIIRRILDQMANVAGRATSPIFDNQGRYIPARP
jgi:hypothetical protein